mgnify:CR=1 FL=1
MASQLVIVESPSKVSKIQKFLGNTYKVSSSKGHIRNLNPKGLSIDVDDGFKPTYIVVSDKQNVVRELKRLMKGIEVVWLAQDFDREGEAIAWHVAQVLKLKKDQMKRIVFTEITKKAITDAIAKPSEIDMNMFYSQQARMILDKLIGYKLSPILWNKYKNFKLSAGRVQSVVVKIISEREDEIKKFQSKNYYKLDSRFFLSKEREGKSEIETTLNKTLESKEKVNQFFNLVKKENLQYIIDSISTNKSKRKASPPFITSSLQQEASNKLGMSPTVTMKCAQKLYENGLITYMRTDSLKLADEAMNSIRDYITKEFGESYYQKNIYKTKSASSQEAHEACRPTNLNKSKLTPQDKLQNGEHRLYELIWRRTIASQMKPAEVEIKTIKIKIKDDQTLIKDYIMVSKLEKILFEGYLKVYKVSKNLEDDESGNSTKTNNKMTSSLEKQISKLKKGQEVYLDYHLAIEKSSKPPNGRFTEASLIKKLEDLGIGRPSTFASMTTKVQDKNYVEKKTVPPVEKDFEIIKMTYDQNVIQDSKKMKVDGEKNKLFPTPMGYMINGYLLQEFDNLLDYQFTAKIEGFLDEIAQGQKIWHKVVHEVFNYFNPKVEKLLKIKSDSNSKSTSGMSQSIIELGTHPKLSVPIIALTTKYGPAVCLNHEDKSKRKYANFTGDVEEMTLAKALDLLQYPKELGKHQTIPVMLNKKNGYYLSYNKKNIALKDVEHPENITLQEAIQLIKTKTASDIKLSDDIVVKNGPYGFYIKYQGKQNISIPKKYHADIKKITLETCQEIIQKKKSNKK